MRVCSLGCWDTTRAPWDRVRAGSCGEPRDRSAGGAESARTRSRASRSGGQNGRFMTLMTLFRKTLEMGLGTHILGAPCRPSKRPHAKRPLLYSRATVTGAWI